MRINGHGKKTTRVVVSQVMDKNVIAVWRSDNFTWSREGERRRDRLRTVKLQGGVFYKNGL